MNPAVTSEMSKKRAVDSESPLENESAKKHGIYGGRISSAGNRHMTPGHHQHLKQLVQLLLVSIHV